MNTSDIKHTDARIAMPILSALALRPNWFVFSAFDSFFQGETNDKRKSQRFQSNSDYIDLVQCYSRSDAGHNWHRSAARACCSSTCWVLGWHSWKPTTSLEDGLTLAFVLGMFWWIRNTTKREDIDITTFSSVSSLAAVLPFILDLQLKIADGDTTIIKRGRGTDGQSRVSRVERLKVAMIRVAFWARFKIKIYRPDGGEKILLDFFCGMLTRTVNYIWFKNISVSSFCN